MIGVELPMALMRQSIGDIDLSDDGGEAFARSIMTTDTRAKYIAASFEADGRTFTIGGVAKGVGMIHPDMATMLSFITTDADVEGDYLQTALSNAVNLSFNMVDVDGDQSTNDTVLLLANGAAGGESDRRGRRRGRGLSGGVERGLHASGQGACARRRGRGSRDRGERGRGAERL